MDIYKAVLKKIGLRRLERKRTPRQEKRVRARTVGQKRKRLEAPAPVRRSTRISGKPAPTYGKEKVLVADPIDNDPKARKMAMEKVKKDTTESILRKAKAWLEESRSVLLPTVKSEGQSGEGNNPYRKQALDRWGKGVLLSKTDDWETYYLSRLATPSPSSPLDLLQEHYNDCPWKLLVSCCLMSRVSSAAVKEKAIALFFKSFPTPTDTLAAEPSDVFPIIAPLGLFETRFKSIIEVSKRFLTMSPMFQVGLTKELKIYGIGVFGFDSFNIFCRDYGSEMSPADKNLQSYCRWRKQQPHRKPGNRAPQTKKSTKLYA